MAYNHFYPTPLDHDVQRKFIFPPDGLKLPKINSSTSKKPPIDSSPKAHRSFSYSSYYQYEGNNGKNPPFITNEPTSLPKAQQTFDDLPASAFVTGQDHLPEIQNTRIKSFTSPRSISSPMTVSSTESDESLSSSSSSQVGSITWTRDEPSSSSFTRRYNSAPLSYPYQHHHHPMAMVTSYDDSTITSPLSSPLSSKMDASKGCTKCSKTFSRARDLQRHIRSVHTGHKMNKCEICGCSFTRMDSLLRHQRNKTCNNINARSLPAALPEPQLYRKGAVIHPNIHHQQQQ